LNGVFASYAGVKSVAELKADLLADLQERVREPKAEGKDDETGFAMTIDIAVERNNRRLSAPSGGCLPGAPWGAKSKSVVLY